MRKTILTAAAIAGFSASAAFAGGMSEPVMEPEIVIEESASSSHDIVVPIMLLVAIAAIASR